jgi:hypothetical protein
VPRFSFRLDVREPPEKVIAAMVDFSERRPEIWPNLTARLYRVHELGPRSADVTEGTAVPGADVWERVSYEWTDSVVRGVLTDGRIFAPGGTFEFRVEPRGEGTRITNDYDRRSRTILGRCLGAVFQVTGGARSSGPSGRSTARRADGARHHADHTVTVLGHASGCTPRLSIFCVVMPPLMRILARGAAMVLLALAAAGLLVGWLIYALV